MSAVLFFQILINGLAIGSVYILIVLGLDIILRGTKILNFAHGQLYMLGAYTVFIFCHVLKLNYILSFIIAGLVLAIIGALCYLSVFSFIQRRFTVSTSFSNRLLLSAMASVGLMMILQQGTLLGFGTSEKGMSSSFLQVIITIGENKISAARLIILLLSLVIGVGLYFLMFKTKLGKVIRAVSYDAEPVSLQGVNTFVIFLSCFSLGSALAGIAGGIIAPVFAITPTMGTQVIFIALLVLIVGGIGSYKGTILGGLLVGIALSFGYQFIGGIAELGLFIFAIILLIFRPGGILGEAED